MDSYVSAIHHSEVNAFDDVIHLIYEWQSSRLRRSLNILLADPQYAGGFATSTFFSEAPRVPPILDASAILDWLTGTDDHLPSYEDMMRPSNGGSSRLRDEGRHVNQPNSFFTRDVNPESPDDDPCNLIEGRNPLIGLARYEGTRDILGFLASLPETISSAVSYEPGLRNLLTGPAGASFPECLHRLARFQSLSLRRNPGTIRLPWYHPYELSNQFVGWSFLERADQSKLWPMPVMRYRTMEAQSAAYVLSRPITLYPGQRLTGSRSTLIPGSRERDLWLEPVADGTDYRSESTTSGRPDTTFRYGHISFINENPDLTEGQRWFVNLGSVGQTTVDDVVLDHLAFFVDAVDPNDFYLGGCHRLDGVLNLDKARMARIEHVHIMVGTRHASHGNSAANERMILRDSAIRLGVENQTEGCVFKDCYIFCSFNGAGLRFGPKARQNLWIGGEIFGESPVQSLIAGGVTEEGTCHVRWDPGSLGNWLLDGSTEGTIANGRAQFLMEGRAGAVESFYLEENDAFYWDTDRTPFKNTVEITSTGRDNVILSSMVPARQTLDRGQGSQVRTWHAHHDVSQGTVFDDRSWDNLLSNSGLRTDLEGQPACWTASDATVRTTTVGGVNGLRLEPRDGAPTSIHQDILLWNVAENPSPTEPDFPLWSLPGVSQVRALSRSSRPALSAADRTFVASCLVGADPGTRVYLDLQVIFASDSGRTVALPPNRASFLSPAAGQVRELVSRVRLDRSLFQEGGPFSSLQFPGDLMLRFTVGAAASARFSIAAPLVVEGGSLSTAPDRPVTEAGGRLFGPLWLPIPTTVWNLRPGQRLPAPVEARIRQIMLFAARANPGQPPEQVTLKIGSTLVPSSFPLTSSWNALSPCPVVRPGETIEVIGLVEPWRLGLAVTLAS